MFVTSDRTLLPAEEMHNANSPGVPMHILNLCPGMTVLIMRNLAPEDGLVNGARATFISFTQKLVEVDVSGSRHLIPRKTFPISL